MDCLIFFYDSQKSEPLYCRKIKSHIYIRKKLVPKHIRRGTNIMKLFHMDEEKKQKTKEKLIAFLDKVDSKKISDTIDKVTKSKGFQWAVIILAIFVVAITKMSGE